VRLIFDIEHGDASIPNQNAFQHHAFELLKVSLEALYHTHTLCLEATEANKHNTNLFGHLLMEY
jgi:hypothetical protein